MKYLIFLFYALACHSSAFDKLGKNDHLLIAYYTNKPHRGIYLMCIDKDTTVFLIDSSASGKMKPDDLRFLDKNTIIYHGNCIFNIKTKKLTIYKPDREISQSLVLDNPSYVALDDDDDDSNNDSFLLDCYNLKGSAKVLSIQTSSDSFITTNMTKSAENIEFVYFPDCFPNYPAAIKGKTTIKV